MRERLDALAGVIDYPDDGFPMRLEACREALAQGPAQARDFLSRFSERCKERTNEELQEAYTHSFDLNPDCTLEIGWHLFGENYSRGEFLVELRGILRRHGVEETSELPDHLIHVLPALGRMDPEQAGAFVGKHLAPALDKILGGMRGRGCLYENLLEAVRAVVVSPGESLEG